MCQTEFSKLSIVGFNTSSLTLVLTTAPRPLGSSAVIISRGTRFRDWRFASSMINTHR